MDWENECIAMLLVFFHPVKVASDDGQNSEMQSCSGMWPDQLGFPWGGSATVPVWWHVYSRKPKAGSVNCSLPSLGGCGRLNALSVISFTGGSAPSWGCPIKNNASVGAPGTQVLLRLIQTL